MTRPLFDKKLKFNEKKHAYKIGQTKLRSVTEWVKSFFEPFDEKKMAKIIAANRRRKGEKVTATQVKKEWKATAQLGSTIHKEIEEHITGKKDLLEIENLKSLAGIAAFSKLKNTYDVSKEFSEVRVYSEQLGLAGTIDLLLLCNDGTVILVDWKTNRKLYTDGKNATHEAVNDLPDVNTTHYQLQLSTYAFILEKEYGMRVKSLFIYHLQDTGANQIIVEPLHDVVQRMVEHEKRKNSE